jgi:hypothetical protein
MTIKLKGLVEPYFRAPAPAAADTAGETSGDTAHETGKT